MLQTIDAPRPLASHPHQPQPRGRVPSVARLYVEDYLDLPLASGVPSAVWEPYQVEFLDDRSLMAIATKSRQIAWSFTAALWAMVLAILDGQDTIFVSINLEEAQEKIRYAKAIYAAIYDPAKPAIVRDSQTNVELANGARLTSLPGRPPRGRARSNIVLDEFAHTRLHHEIYQAALPILSKGGRLRIGSSPMGARATFWEIYAQKLRPYPGFRRRAVPWWQTYAFTTDLARAMRAGPTLPPADRVAAFGNARIQQIFDNSILDDFLQEYDTTFVDEASGWITWEEIANNATDPQHVWVRETARGSEIDPAIQAILEVSRLIDGGQIEQTLVAGNDIGRTRDLTEIMLLGQAPGGRLPLRANISLENMPLPKQEIVLRFLMATLPIVRLVMDRTGLGRQLGDAMHGLHPLKVVALDFTNELKNLWATDARQALQQLRAPLPIDRDLHYQIHSVNRSISGAGNFRFENDPQDKHHADQFWAWCLAIYADKLNRLYSQSEIPDSSVQSNMR